MSERMAQLRSKINGSLSEADFLKMVIDLCHLYKWRVAHFRPARTSKGWRTPVQADAEGFPDLVIVRKGELLFAEVKSKKGKISLKQWEWIDALRKTGHLAEIWRPSDWDRIFEMLK